MKLFKVVHDGPSRPMIETPQGRLLSISQLEGGRWNSYDKEEEDCKIIVDALNSLLVNENQQAVQVNMGDHMHTARKPCSVCGDNG